MRTYLIGPVLALLPARWRQALFPDAQIVWPRAALLSGVVEAVGCLLALILWYLVGMQRTVGRLIDVSMRLPTSAPVDDHTVGFMALILFVLHPLTWALAYFGIEGALRAVSAAVSGEAHGSLPLVLLDRALTLTRRRVEGARVPLVPDEVTRGDGREAWHLRVASCRPKTHWKYPLTISYEGEFFQVAGGNAAAGRVARPHVYLLRRLPPEEIVRGLEHYDPREVLREGKTPGFFGAVLGVLRERFRIARLPLVPDEIQQLRHGAEEFLEVRSCRPKPEWAPAQLVRHRERYYRVESWTEGTAPRPFVFLLRRLAAGVPSRNVLVYSPDQVLSSRR